MGLTITATFEAQGIYFAGETLECHIRFANVRSSQNPHGNGRSLSTGGHAIGIQRGENSQSQYPASRKSTGRVPFQRVVSGVSNNGRRTFGETSHFPSLDDNSEYSASSAAVRRQTGTRRYSAVADTNSSNHRYMATTPDKSARDSEKDNSNGTPEQVGNSGLAVFPVLGETPPAPSVLLPPPLDTHRLYRGSTGGYGGRTPQERQPSALSRMPQNSTKGRASTTASPVDGTGYHPRQSTSSIISNPSTGFTSRLPFIGRAQHQHQQQQHPKQLGLGQVMRQQSARSSPADAPASDAGSSGLLSSLWRNLSGGSNPPSLPSTRAGSIVDENAGIEHLAIGFAEMSGSLVLAASYIRPEQMELLLAHNGTDYVARKGIGSPPIGGGLSGWMPTAGSSNGTSSRSQKTLPLLVSSPTVLFSELDLGPGESQTFSVKVQLPKSLPPSFRGRTGRISYDLVIVAKRSMLEPSAHVVRIPFRVLAYVGSSGALDTFSMARPIQMQPGHIKLTYQDEITVSTPRNTSPSFSSEQDEHSQLGSHSKHETLGVEFLPPLASLEDPKENTSEVYKQLTSSLFLQSLIQAIDSEMSADPQVVPSIELFSHSTILESSSNGDDSDSARNIQLACRKRAPVSFSLSQDGHAVASVWLPKRVYQLGDIVAGKVDIHQGAVSVYQVSIWLESVETIGSDYASCAQSRTEELTRRIYSEHHGFCRSMRTLGFSLAPPQTTAATAASFSSSIISNVWQLRIELIIGASGSPAASDYTLSAATPFPPVKLLPHSTGTDSQNSVQLMPANDALPDDDRTLASQRYHYPPISAGASGSVSDHVASNVRSSSGRLRSSTIVGNGVGVIGAMHQHRHRVNDGDSRAMQAVAQHASTSAFQRTVRRRYDAVPKLATQKLSCTVAIQMHPSPLKLPHPGHKDVYSIDIGTQ